MSTSVASVVSHFPSAENGFTTTLASTISSGATTVPLNSVAGYTNGETAVFVVDPSDATKKQTFTGVIDTGGVQVTSVVWTAGTNQSHSGGATVVDYATATHISMITKGLLRDHNQSGYHKTLKDDSGNEWIEQGSTASAVNQVKITNAATATDPIISAAGSDSNVGLALTPKGTSGVYTTKRFDGWTTGLTAPDTVAANGNRSYTLTFNSLDLTGFMSPGMRVRTTRTVAAPDQCTDLEASSSQYYSKTSPAGMTFTDDFVVSAWVKLESYTTTGVIASRFNGTSGWQFRIKETTGQIEIYGFNASGGNYSGAISYQSVPLNKWVHVTAQLDMSTFTATTTTTYMMIDGVDVPCVVTRGGTNPTALIQAGNLEIGSTNSGTSPFDGKIAQVAIYSAKVTQATILASINQGLTGSETSLISAYSFDNSINDLSATANNLTAQNSAVATNTDSPFGNEAASSTLDYGLVQSVSFSTNTTMVVQVPSGCTIPTTGGITSMAYSVQANPYGWVNDATKWDVSMIQRVQAIVSFGGVNDWYVSPLKITLPIGNWQSFGYQGTFQLNSSVAGTRHGHITMATSTPTTAVRDQDYTSQIFNSASAGDALVSLNKTLPYSNTSVEVYFIYGSIVTSTGTETYQIRGDLGAVFVSALPAGL